MKVDWAIGALNRLVALCAMTALLEPLSLGGGVKLIMGLATASAVVDLIRALARAAY